MFIISPESLTNPKKECLKFTPDGALAIIGERKSFKDAVAVIKLSDWSLDTHFYTDTNDFQMIRMNGDGAGTILKRFNLS